ncbi:hypothetical protein M422DRAFT_228303 [Sphaerobolus stellatus SS14]|uniref:COX assembly mitochondrial protein n=1 Tax=Sphaerobolus stellatus (strain SS14) TaxID=990650 RepID=A0A0C9W050_SPHS4|nr:hypothetical protein M422DRAFT_228303 [Sphaerobolus stellatus SS14]
MHPQLTDKRISKLLSLYPSKYALTDFLCIVCKDFIEALERCHSEWWGARFIGTCNQTKHELNMCLRRERLERQTQNQIVAKERKERREAAWKDLTGEEA